MPLMVIHRRGTHHSQYIKFRFRWKFGLKIEEHCSVPEISLRKSRTTLFHHVLEEPGRKTLQPVPLKGGHETSSSLINILRHHDGRIFIDHDLNLLKNSELKPYEIVTDTPLYIRPIIKIRLFLQ